MLTEQEQEQLEEMLMNRFADDIDVGELDEGIFDLSTLDGFFTAIVSGPTMIPPSKWLPRVWGDFEPEWKDQTEFELVFSLLVRYMNGIVIHFESQPENFEPLFLEREIEGKIYSIVDEWCVGYMKGVELAVEQWQLDQSTMRELLTPMMLFGTEDGWEKLLNLTEEETEKFRCAITPNVRKIQVYWRTRREQDNPVHFPVRRSEPRISRNDPCPCGSGKKYKKCCLH